MPPNTQDQSLVLASVDWDEIDREEAAGYEEDQRAAIRPELSAAWSKLVPALGEFAYALAYAFGRASIQERRSAIVRMTCRAACNAFDRASMRLARPRGQEPFATA